MVSVGTYEKVWFIAQALQLLIDLERFDDRGVGRSFMHISCLFYGFHRIHGFGQQTLYLHLPSTSFHGCCLSQQAIHPAQSPLYSRNLLWHNNNTLVVSP
jgi:hypothetical protein